MIERGLQDIAGVSGTKYGAAMRAVDKIMVQIKRIRLEAIKASFRHIRSNSYGTPSPWTAELEESLPPEFQWDGHGVPPPEFQGYSLAQWAAYFAADDAARIDGAVRGGVLSGLDNVEIGRKVVGSASLNGIDGQTEITRRKIARLGVAEIKTIKGKSHAKRH